MQEKPCMPCGMGCLENVSIRRVAEITTDKDLVKLGTEAIESPKVRLSKTWLAERREAAVDHVYSSEVVQVVSAAARIGATIQEVLSLSDEYLTNAGRVAQVRAIESGYHVEEVWKAGL